jgi:PST family polysaccharide transporter
MHVVGYSISVTLAKSVDRIALGLFYRPHEIGLYQNALVLYDNTIVNTLGQIHNVGSTALGKLQSNRDSLRQKFYSALSVLAFYVMPAAAIMSVTGQDLVLALLGEKWRGSGILLSILALRGIFQVIHSSQGWLHLAIGRPDRWRNWGVFTAGLQGGAVLAGLPFGPVGVAIAISVVGSLVAFPAVSYAGRPVDIDAMSVFRAVKAQLIGAILTVVVGWVFQGMVLAQLSSIARLFVSAGFCTAFYLFVVAGIFRCTEPIKVFGVLLDHYLPAAWHSHS